MGKVYRNNSEAIIMGLTSFIRKIVYRHRADSDTYVKYLQSKGAKIGERVTIFEPHLTRIDDTRAFLISIGNDVKITVGVTMLTHGYDWNVLSGIYKDVLGSAGRINIGNNVFIGMHTTILKGVNIGNNVIIGANSLVAHDIPDNCIVAGNPARIIMDLDAYHEKRVAAQESEAFDIYESYVESFGIEPPKEIFDEFFWLFEERSNKLIDAYAKQMKWHDNYNDMLDNYINSVPKYSGYEDFCKYCRNKMTGYMNRNEKN